jgi:putative ABC transport system permease protein
VACYIEMSSCYTNLVDAKSSYYVQCRMADFSIELKKVPLADLAVLEEFVEIVEYRPRIQFFATVDLERVPELLNGLVLSLPDERQPVINDIVLRRGSYFTHQRRNEVIVNDAFARRHALRPGQWIHLILNNRRQELFIVGTAISSEFVYLLGPGAIAPDPEHFGVFYLKHSFAEETYDFEGAANHVVGRFTPAARRHPEDVLRRAEARLASFGVFNTTPLKNQASNRFLTSELEALATITTIMPSIFLAVAALVLNVLLTRLTQQQRTMVGTLKALGYTDREVFGHFLKFGLFIALAGGLAGCGLGYWLAGLATGLYRQFYEFPALENQFYPGKSLIGLAIAVVCSLVGTWHGAQNVLKLSPAQAMRPKPPPPGGKTLLEHAGWLWRRLGFAWRLVLRDIFRNRLRTAAGLFAAAMGSCILYTGFSMQQAMMYLIDFQFNLVQRSDLDLAFKDEQGADAWREARLLPGVDHAEPILDVSCTFSFGPYHKRGGVTGLLPDARLTIPRDDQGRRVRIPDSGLAMTRVLADLLHVETGDFVTVQPIKGRRQPRQAQVVEITDSYLGTAVYANIHYLNHLIDEQFTTSGVQLLADPSPQALARLHRELKRLPALQSVSARADFIRNLKETIIDTQQIFIGMLIAFAGVIFFGSVLNASLISLSERTREVATFRVLGYGPWQVGGMFLRESLIINLTGTVLGIPLGHQLNRALAASYNTEMFRIPVVNTPSVWLTILCWSLVFALLAHVVVQREIHRIHWLDALKGVE